MESILMRSLCMDINRLEEKTKEIRGLLRRDAEIRFEETIPLRMKREKQINKITYELLGERGFFNRIRADYNNLNGYDVDCIRIAVGECLEENAKNQRFLNISKFIWRISICQKEK